ncbi:metal-dependent transcriptional regulator [Georgenia sp. TF02-10]|uniref:metal-dependent transcriptional regulator n=1 Tax=Georgenia sp. TF02-10 TaxID=2917725 RepID=UPI001FA737C2|nr:metal-dependent transcriptional regulator [Georgenia sp. TF02-10]UNX55531.1 metal-dependent transcriptional regulator [Georgenia sp. TF02-10]
MAAVLEDLSAATQDYLKVVWSAQEWSDEPVTTTSLARRMGFAPSTVSEAVKRLTAQGLLTHARYGAIELTDAGRAAAVGVVRRHRILETFLAVELGYGWDEVHDEAEVLEHAVSDRLVDALDARLGHPVRDPHGDPIPGPDGTVPAPAAHQLHLTAAGERVVVARVADTDPQVLRYLEGLGITLDTALTVLERRDFAGTLLVDVDVGDGGGGDGDGGPREVGLAAAAAVWVVRR